MKRISLLLLALKDFVTQLMHRESGTEQAGLPDNMDQSSPCLSSCLQCKRLQTKVIFKLRNMRNLN